MGLPTFVTCLFCAEQCGHPNCSQGSCLHFSMPSSLGKLLSHSASNTAPALIFGVYKACIRSSLKFKLFPWRKKRQEPWRSSPNGLISQSSVSLFFFSFSLLSGFISLINYKNNEEKRKPKSLVNLAFPSPTQSERTALCGSKIGMIHLYKNIFSLLCVQFFLRQMLCANAWKKEQWPDRCPSVAYILGEGGDSRASGKQKTFVFFSLN